jgi:hypothetical protein
VTVYRPLPLRSQREYGKWRSEVPELPSVRGYSWATLYSGVQIQRPGPLGWGLGVRLITSPCKNKFVENLLKEKILEDAKAHL